MQRTHSFRLTEKRFVQTNFLFLIFTYFYQSKFRHILNSTLFRYSSSFDFLNAFTLTPIKTNGKGYRRVQETWLKLMRFFVSFYFFTKATLLHLLYFCYLLSLDRHLFSQVLVRLVGVTCQNIIKKRAL